MEKADLSKLAAIPYLDLSDLQQRTLSSLCFYDGDWKMWISAGDRLIQTRAWPAESFYFARAPERQSDLCLQTLSFIAQRASFSELMKAQLRMRAANGPAGHHSMKRSYRQR